MQLISLFFYNISIRFYWLGIFLSSPFNHKAKLWLQGRKNPYRDIGKLNSLAGKRYWFHCASLGEFEQARPLMEMIKANNPAPVIILTFFSPSGYEVRKNYAGADAVLYLPLDTKANAAQFISQLKPDIALFVKYEFWYHHLHKLKRNNIPVVLFSSVFRKQQIFFKWYGSFFREMLGLFDKIFVQNEESIELLKRIAINAEVAPDTRFDRVHRIFTEKKIFPPIEKFKSASKLLIAGSTWQKDEELLVKLINENVLTGYKYIIAPHNINENDLQNLEKSLHPVSLRYSNLTEANAGEATVVIVDTIGDLAALYAYGSIAYVGGGFNAGVHNVLEAAVYGMPVLFGPAYNKSEEAKTLMAKSAAFSTPDYESLSAVVQQLNSDPATMARAAKEAGNYVTDNLGGTEKIYRYLLTIVR